MGIVINRPLTLTEAELFEHLSIALTPQDPIRHVLAGGPVQTDRGFVLHRPFGEWLSTWHVSDDVEITTSRDVLQAMAKGDGPPDAFIALGYAGWGPGQLEKELTENAWLTVPASAHIVFDVPVDQRWNAAARLLGINPAFLSSEIGHA
jgi:putative transcriptional regulator